MWRGATTRMQVTEKRQRRTQAERSATTRSALLEAAVESLYARGYGATTTINVAEAAGVSRGAMLHQFPSKADLMVFVVEEVFAEEVELYHELLAGIDDPRERLLAYPEAAWKVLSRPAGVAVQEIMQGSRSDPELAQKLAPIIARIDATAHSELSREFPRGPSSALRQLIVGTVRGLSVMNILKPGDEGVLGAIPLLKRLLRAGIETGVFADKGRAPPSQKSSAAAKPKTKPTVAR
ncbi:helix-turn-helix domain-containing protein [Caulobacter sp. CCNWLY153]|uniref:TetR/AcrR family transcriptional regulator n=1 Tax=unclassified Caulobacter TaxID=2648921 RepID=UPI0030148C42